MSSALITLFLIFMNKKYLYIEKCMVLYLMHSTTYIIYGDLNWIAALFSSLQLSGAHCAK